MFTILSMETMLSVDNAAVLAVMVEDLPKEQQPRALKYGIAGAFILRGVCLVSVSWLISMWYLKILGGAWLIYLCIKHFRATGEGDTNSSVFKWAIKYVSVFWATVALVEVMDLTFSMDNIFAVTAMSKLIGWIVVGVFIGIVAMRFVATRFIKLMEKFPFLEDVAFVIIALLGVKLMMTWYTHYHPTSALTKALESTAADYITSGTTITIFLIPIVTSLLFGIPSRGKPDPSSMEEKAATIIEEGD